MSRVAPAPSAAAQRVGAPAPRPASSRPAALHLACEALRVVGRAACGAAVAVRSVLGAGVARRSHTQSLGRPNQGASPESGAQERRRAAQRRLVCRINRRRPTLPGPCGPSTIGAEGLNCSVRNGKRCFPLAKATGKSRETLRGPSKLHSANALRITNYPSSPRPISTGLLQALPPFQIQPIDLVVYQGSYSL